MILTAALAAGAAAGFVVARRSAAAADRLHAEAEALLDALRGARTAALGRVNAVRAALRTGDGKPAHRVRLLPTGDEVVCWREAQTLLDLAWENGVEIPSACGGCAECGTCRVRVLEGLDRLPPKSPKERRTLSMYTEEADVRLSCLLRVNADLTAAVEIDQDQFPVVVPPRPARQRAGTSTSTATSAPSSR